MHPLHGATLIFSHGEIRWSSLLAAGNEYISWIVLKGAGHTRLISNTALIFLLFFCIIFVKYPISCFFLGLILAFGGSTTIGLPLIIVTML